MKATHRENRKTAIDVKKLIDLTHSLDEHTIHWPGEQPFAWKPLLWGEAGDGGWCATGFISMPEHTGTHLDAPIHFSRGKPTVGQLPLDRLVAPAVVIDVRAACSSDRDYLLSAGDIGKWEEVHGVIAPGEIVLVRTGWGRYWPEPKAYLGTDRDDAAQLSFPGVGGDAAELLRDRAVAGVGIDACSIDAGKSGDFRSHKILTAAGIFLLENLANLERLPETGATLLAFPLKLASGSGGPARVVGLLP